MFILTDVNWEEGNSKWKETEQSYVGRVGKLGEGRFSVQLDKKVVWYSWESLEL